MAGDEEGARNWERLTSAIGDRAREKRGLDVGGSIGFRPQRMDATI